MKILSINDSIIKIQPEKGHFLNQLIMFNKNVMGVVIKTSMDGTFVVVDDSTNITMSSKYEILKKDWIVQSSNSILGKIIDVFGNTLFENSNVKIKKDDFKYPEKLVESKSPDFSLRKKLDQPLRTGIFSIDSLFPIGKGQRELIIGDRKTGKTSIALSTIINQKKQNIKVVYVAIGQKQTTINWVYKTLEENGALDYTTIISADPTLKLSQYMAPYIGMAYAESFASNNEDVLIIFDDLTKHANILREISLNINKPGGREAYPSDLFYFHSKLLERAGKFDKSIGGGTITSLPIAEIVDGDFATILATNIISITDGQIITDTSLSDSNKFPAVNISLSVSRTGSAVQSKMMKGISKDILKIYTKYIEAKKYELISMEVSEDVKKIIKQGQTLISSFEQFGYEGRTENYMYLLAQIINWDIFVGTEKNFSIDEMINFMKNDKTGKIFMDKFSNNKSEFNIELFKAYFKSILGKENEYNAKRSPIEIRLGGKDA